jgi:drug/metabolite transporter (DMT)-like permease
MIYATVIAFTDNFVRVIAADAGLWQFHATRSVMAIALLVAVAIPLGLRLRPKNWRGVLARSVIHGTAMLFYFGALAFLPVAQVAAGLFTAPIFVLLIQRFAYGRQIGFWHIAAVALGFAGVVFVLGPTALSGATLAALLPVLSGALYAMGNIATREWCAHERAEVLLAGFFAILGVMGLAGLCFLAVFPVPVPLGADGFVQRGLVWPSGTFLWWTFVQAAGSLLGVGLIIRAYQIAEASTVSVFEYVILPASALWGWLLWGEVLAWPAITGIVLIAVAGAMIARQSPTASRQWRRQSET